MTRQLTLLLSSALFLLPNPSAAQGMKYTTLNGSKPELKSNDLKIKSLNFEQEEKKRLELETKDQKEKEVLDNVWQRYRDLAQGKKTKKKTDKALPAAPAKPKKISVKSPEIPKTKSLGILDQYEQHKARRSQMKMITIKRDDADKSETEKDN